MVMAETEFIDYYELLRISPDAEPDSIQRVHRALAARYHPDNKETGDLERFLLVNSAYKILADPAKRKEYDAEYQTHKGSPIPMFLTREFTDGVEGESNRRMGVLCILYTRRRTNPHTPSVSVLEMEALTSVQVALLTIYDMCKAVDRGMTITDVSLLQKHGGKSGSFVSGSPSTG